MGIGLERVDPSTTLRMTKRGAMESAGVHGASAGRSFDYAQDDETGAAMESEGGHRARAGGSFGYAQDDETGAAMESAGVHGASAD